MLGTEELSAGCASASSPARPTDHGYYPKPGAHLYASVRLTGKLTTRFYASIVIAPDYKRFELKVRQSTMAFQAVELRPLRKCGKRPLSDGPVVTIHLEPSHDYFRAFGRLMRPGILPLERSSFATMDDALRAAAMGDLSLDEASVLIDYIVGVVVQQLPACRPQDVRVRAVCDLLRLNPCCALDEIAAALGLSYDRTSHLFTEAVGLPFRSYRLWQKVRRANRLLWLGESLTSTAHAAGFADSAHLCRTYQQVFGRPPSYFFDGRCVKIHAPRPAQSTVSTATKRE